MKLPIDEIVVGFRHRHAMGDIAALKASIESVGLIHPIAVTPNKELISGGRRLAALRSLGVVRVDVHIVHGMNDAATALRAELDENTCREEMKVSELVALGKRLEELEKPKASERQEDGRKRGGEVFAGREASPPPGDKASGTTSKVVAPAVGMSIRTYERAKRVVEATQDEDPVIAEVAKKAVEEMDKTGKVRPAEEKIREARKPPEKPKATPKYGGNRKRHLQVVESINTSLSGLAFAADEITALDDTITSEEATRLSGDLSKSLASLRRLNALLSKEITK